MPETSCSSESFASTFRVQGDVFARRPARLVDLVDDGVPQPRFLALFGGDPVALVDGDIDLGVFVHAGHEEGEPLLPVVAGRQGEVGLEKVDAPLLDLEDGLHPQGAAGAAEGEHDETFRRILLGILVHTDLGGAVAGGHPGGEDADVAAFRDLDPGGVLLALDVFPVRGDLLDAGTDDLGLVPDHQRVAELLVEEHPEGAGLLGRRVFGLRSLPGGGFLFALPVSDGTDEGAEDGGKPQADGCGDDPGRHLSERLFANARIRPDRLRDVASVRIALIEIVFADLVRLPADPGPLSDVDPDADDHEGFLSQLERLVPGATGVGKAVPGADVPVDVPPGIPVVVSENVLGIQLLVDLVGILLEVVFELRDAVAVREEVPDGCIVQGIFAGAQLGHDLDLQRIFVRFGAACVQAFRPGIERVPVPLGRQGQRNLVLLSDPDVFGRRGPPEGQVVHLFPGLGGPVGIRDGTDQVEIECAVPGGRDAGVAAVRALAVEQDHAVLQGPVAVVSPRRSACRGKQQETEQEPEASHGARGVYHPSFIARKARPPRMIRIQTSTPRFFFFGGAGAGACG